MTDMATRSAAAERLQRILKMQHTQLAKHDAKFRQLEVQLMEEVAQHHRTKSAVGQLQEIVHALNERIAALETDVANVHLVVSACDPADVKIERA